MSPTQRRALRNGVVAFAVTALVGFGVDAMFEGPGGERAAATRTPEPPASPSCAWTAEQVASADPDPAGSQLLSVVALSGTDVWAVGSTGSPDAPEGVLVEHWDGRLWTAVEAPNVGATGNVLAAVDGTGPDDLWAVGWSSTGTGDQPTILHWDGTAWVAVTVPSLLGGAALTDVVALSPTDAWAVGYEGDTGIGSERALILHWDGTAWVDPGAQVGGGKSLLRSVDASGPDDVWAVGYHHQRPAAMRFDGRRWRWAELDARGELFGVSAGAPGQAWAVGGTIQRWDGTAWGPAGRVRRGGELAAAAAPSAAGLWAVGHRPVESGLAALIQVFDGRRWALVPVPPVAGSESLTAVAALPDGSGWAVGYRDTRVGRRTLVLELTTTCG
ncbi:MAG: hypothetical protein ACE14W_01340 [Candidatus Velamenicoccus archaeovorus]